MKCERCGQPVNGLDVCPCYLSDTTPKFLESITEHPDVQRLIIQVETLSQENKIMRAMLVAEGLLDE